MKTFLRIVLILGVILMSLVLFGRYVLQSPLENIVKNALPEQQYAIQSLLENKDTITQNIFRSFDGELELVYPKTWILVPQKSALPYGQKVLLRVAKFTPQGSFAQLIVTELTPSQTDLEQILEDMKMVNAEQGWNTEITDSVIGEDGIAFEALYTTDEGDALRSKEKILLPHTKTQPQKVYVVAVLANESEWEEFAKETEDILNSVQLAQYSP